MSRTKEEKLEKKRKRDVDATEDAPKKTKKSKGSEHVSSAPAAEAPAIGTSKAKADKKEKKSKKSKKLKAEAAAVAAEVVLAPEEKKEKKSKKSKKTNKDTDSSESAPADEAELIQDMKASENFISINDDEPVSEVHGTADTTVSKKDRKKSKEEKKAKKDKKDRKAAMNGEVSDEAQPIAETNGDATTEVEGVEEGVEANGEADEETKKGRFIVFVGNLPYSATKEQIEEHFAKIKPTEIRLRTYKGTNKFMGTCFVEFDRFDRMETCLKKYHHSVFPDTKNKKGDGRKINVELSAGGGGNSNVRRERIATKNDKLHDERARDREKRAELEMKQSERKEKKESIKKADKGTATSEDNFGMNPARLAMMQRPAPPTHRQRY